MPVTTWSRWEGITPVSAGKNKINPAAARKFRDLFLSSQTASGINTHFGSTASSTMKQLPDIGLVGLAAMGANQILNMASKGYRVTAYSRTKDKVDNFIEGRAAAKNIRGASSVEELVASLESPRKIMLDVARTPPPQLTMSRG